jgi:RNA polymerase sigma-70 factor (ECF subfamily)
MNQIEFCRLQLYSRQSLSISKRLLISTEEAEDATQEILVKLWSKTSLVAISKAFAMTMTKIIA